MNKLIIAFLVLLFNYKVVYANIPVLFINKSKTNDLYITYGFCHWNGSSETCSKIDEFKLGNMTEGKHWTTLDFPTGDSSNDYLQIIKAVERDINGNMVAEVIFDGNNLCHAHAMDTAFVFDDMKTNKYIICSAHRVSSNQKTILKFHKSPNDLSDHH